MTFIFAALLGNFLAWCVHAFTWWLREKCLWLIGLAGYVIGALSVGWFFLLIGLSGLGGGDYDTPEDIKRYAQEDAMWNKLLLQIAIVWFVVAILGFYQRRWLKIESRLSEVKHDARLFEQEFARVRRARRWRAFDSVGAIYSEIASAVYLSYLMCNHMNDDTTFLAAVALTLFILAFIRPQVVKVQKWLWQQVRPQRAANE